MKDLLRTYLPNAPKLGLYVAPNIPEKLVRNALRDYAKQIDAREVIALFDATLLGSGTDGIVFAGDRLVYQNHDFQPAQTIRYDDIVNVEAKRKLLGGKKIQVDANSASATVTHTIDFSGKPDAVEYVARFLREAMLTAAAPKATEAPSGSPSGSPSESRTDVPTVETALLGLVETGKLDGDDFRALVDLLHRRNGRA